MLARFILISAVSGSLCGTLGLVAGLQWAAGPPPPRIEEHRSLRAPEPRPASLDVEALASRLAQQLAVDLEATLTRTLEEHSVLPAASGATSQAANSARTDQREAQRAYEHGGSLLDDAVTRGRWDDRHIEELSALLPSMSLGQRTALFVSLAEAANRGDIELGDDPLAVEPQ